MAVDVEALKRASPIEVVVANYVELKARGSEFLGLCPLHKEDSPSFYVNPSKGTYYCHGCGSGGDVIHFLQELEGLSFSEACKKLNGGSDWKSSAKPPRQVEARPERVTSKPPAGGAPPMKLRNLGEPARVWAYYDAKGAVLGYVARYEASGKKEIRCWTWGARGDEAPAWGCGHWSKPRPLYGLETLALKRDSPVLVVEGEKAADAAQALLPQYAVLTWPGGANAWKHADWSALRGLRVDLWPDADEPGREAMASLRAILADPNGLDCHGKMIDTSGLPDGFDAADLSPDTDAIEWLRSRAPWYREPQTVENLTPNPAPQGADTARSAGLAPEPSSPEGSPPTGETFVSPAVAGPDAPGSSESDFPADATLRVKPARKTRQKRLKPQETGETRSDDDDDDEPLPAAMSEDFMADRFAAQHCECWRYVNSWRAWYEWRGDGWYRDDTAKAFRLAVELTRQAVYWQEARALTPEGLRRVNSRRTAGAVHDLALSDRRIAATVDQWDRNAWLLGVPGGAVDLRDGLMQPARPEDYITKRTLVAPREGDAPIWRAFLETVMDGNAGMISFLQSFAGYCLTGETTDQCLAFLYGTGQNGKGVFITTLSKIMGDYACTADADVFMESDQTRHSTEVARLRGARLVAVDETDSSKRWNEKLIKRVTGGGRIEARFMRQDNFEFEPQFKLFLAGNHKPQLRGVGKAMQRRIHLIPFTVTIPDAERDHDLLHKLEAEYPMILSWMIEGALRWREERLRPPAEVIDATSRYIEGEDVIGEWLEERTEQKGTCERPGAYKNYRAWVEARGERAWSSKAFWAALEEKGYTVRKSTGTWRIQGLQLRIPEREADGYDVD